MQLAVLEGELDVLHVPEVPLELLRDALELAVYFGELATLERGDRLGGSGARDDVLTLRVGEHVAVEHRLARAAVAREGDAGPGIVPHVAVDHRDHVHRGTQIVGDAVHPAGIHRPAAGAPPLKTPRLPPPPGPGGPRGREDPGL